MARRFAACGAFALFLGLGGQARAADAEAEGYGYCESGLAGNGYVYISPVFAEPPLYPEASFERYLAKNFGYDGSAVKCFSLDSQHEAAGLREQSIELFHWRHEDHILATSWTPAEPSTRSSVS